MRGGGLNRGPGILARVKRVRLPGQTAERGWTNLKHQLAHGFEFLAGVVLSVEQRVVGHLPQLHHDVTQLSLCTERGRKKENKA